MDDMEREHVSLTIDAFTPDTLPLSRLAEYLRPFAVLLGSEASVHFESMRSGSAQCRVIVDAHDAPKVRERLQAVASKTAPRAAMKAYAEIDELLAKDNAIGGVSVGDRSLIEFPGRRRAAHEIIGPVRRTTSIDGQVYSIAGRDETINIHLRNKDAELKCVVSVALARSLGQHLLGKTVRLYGEGLWNRVDGAWQMKTFTADRFIVLDDSPLPDSLDAVRDIFDGVSPDATAVTLFELRQE